MFEFFMLVILQSTLNVVMSIIKPNIHVVLSCHHITINFHSATIVDSIHTGHSNTRKN